MGSISLRNVGVTVAEPLFQNLDLVIADGDRIGLVAGNGGGKSTLLRCLAGQAEPSAGTIIRSRGLKVGFVEQDVPANLLDLPLAEMVRRAIPPADRESQGWRVDLVLDELETPDDLRARPLRALSGGWQRLALLARTWVADPDALLLDEPTNHLDLDKIRLLEGWITSPLRQVPMVIASHDRQFLEACTNRTLFVRPEASRLYAHPYFAARALLADDDQADATRLARDAKEATRLRQSAAALRNVGINSRSDAAQKKSMQMAQRAEALERTLRPQHLARTADIRLASRTTHARVLAAFDDVTVRTPDGRALFRTGKLEVRQQDRIVLLGRNGVGKSQLVALLRRAMADPEAMPGVRVAPTVVLGYLDQQMSQLPPRETPHDFIGGTFRLGDQRTTSLLAGAGFMVDRQRQTIDRLSPGQKARLGLLAIRLAEPNFYLMDEPTNHVDIAGQEQLEAEILAQQATSVLVSHDRSFARAIGTRWLLIEGGKMKELDSPGDLV
ncbi:ATPase subunit of ABC transporter with duplicated ATPase domains [Stella humosa]|uniref:ATPase subunit of ABC transporter with duplicated ATPase domains n=1 Tax=Stella humosa TaxID=94 RepID=A0A3N1LJW8_9PROT|nr:ABC-F family ATP-binding cassette domain-containing protein [Stella humosa]ROP91168.1 ATPase subunit of ABC transporter with duplicated ATPase domains [Stella humosa]BBK34480.1 ABC transporter [Stella humosa]